MTDLGSIYGTTVGGSNTLVIDFSNVDICGNLKVNGQTQNSKVFMRMNANQQLGNMTESTIASWVTPSISNPAGLYGSSTNIFNPPRDGFYSINFQTTLESTTWNSVFAIIKLYQTIGGTEYLVSQSQEQEANETTMVPKYRFLNINIILYMTTTDALRITIQADGAYRLPAAPSTNLSIHNVD